MATRPTIRSSGNKALIRRVGGHLGEDFLEMTVEEIAHYHDGGQHGGCPDPRSLAAHRALGELTAWGRSSGPKRK